MQQEQWWSTREFGPFEEPGDHTSGCRIVDLRHHRHLGHRSDVGMARTGRCCDGITGEYLLITMVTITRVVRLVPGPMGRTDKLGVRRQLARVPQNEKQH